MSTSNPILFKQTITSNGSGIHRDGAVSQVVLFWTISGLITGINPTIQFVMEEVIPIDESTPTGLAISSPIISTTGAGSISLSMLNSPVLVVSWIVGGTNPSFESVSVSTVAKTVTDQIASVSSAQIKTVYDLSSTTVNYVGTAPVGTATSDAAWTIKKITFDGSGNPTATLWSSSTSIWDNRTTTVVYS